MKPHTKYLSALTVASLLTLSPGALLAQDGCTYGSNCGGYGGGTPTTQQSGYDEISGLIQGVYDVGEAAANTYAVGATYYLGETGYFDSGNSTYPSYDYNYYYPGYEQSYGSSSDYSGYEYTGGYGYDQEGYYDYTGNGYYYGQ